MFHKKAKYDMKWKESNFMLIPLLKVQLKFLPIKIRTNHKDLETFKLT